MQLPTIRDRREVREQLRRGVGQSALRGRLLASIGVLLLCLSAVIGGLFVVALLDALFVLPSLWRGVLLILFVVVAIGVGLWLAIKPWLNKRFNLAASEQIDRAAHDLAQPVTLGLSLNEPIDDDSLALMLLRRAEQRAADVAQWVKPNKAYPLGLLRMQGSWLLLAVGAWLFLALVVPSQVSAMLARVVTPWGSSPPFSLTQLDPVWTPAPPDAGDDVMVSVQPQGLMPKSVEWVRIDEQGKEAERFEMIADGQGGHRLLLKSVAKPITFQLEAHGRHTRTYTITPTPIKPKPAEQDAEDTTDTTDKGDDHAGGSTSYDPDKIGQRDLNAHRDWPGMKDKLDELVAKLADAQALAQSIDPDDAAAIKALADQLAKLTEQAESLAGELSAIQAELPTEAAAAMAQLRAALTNMQSASLPSPPGASSASDGSTPLPSQWLDQAKAAAQADQRSIGRGIGPSDLPTDSGNASGQPGDESPTIRDPRATGSYDEAGVSGNTGPLPDAVMQQVPPSYRDFVAAYFERLADEQDNP